MNNQLFSVLIANYNNAEYIQEAINSVFSQSYKNWEIIVVDDASTDASSDILKKYAGDSWVHVFYNTRNMGCGFTKRRCAELAKGELCGFLDSDDVLLPDALETMVKMHEMHKDVSSVFSRFYICDENLVIRDENRLLSIKPGFSYLTNRDYTPEHFVSFKKVCYDKTSGISEKNKAGVDQDLYFKLEEVAPVMAIDKFTYKYRVHDNSVSHQDVSKSIYWNICIRHEACLRRGISPEEYSYIDMCELFDEKLKELKYTGTLEVTRSKSYRLGHFLLHPFSIFKKK